MGRADDDASESSRRRRKHKDDDASVSESTDASKRKHKHKEKDDASESTDGARRKHKSKEDDASVSETGSRRKHRHKEEDASESTDGKRRHKSKGGGDDASVSESGAKRKHKKKDADASELSEEGSSRHRSSKKEKAAETKEIKPFSISKHNEENKHLTGAGGSNSISSHKKSSSSSSSSDNKKTASGDVASSSSTSKSGDASKRADGTSAAVSKGSETSVPLPVVRPASNKAKSKADYEFKVLLLGNSGVGKTCLLMQYAEQTFSDKFVSTIGIDFKVKKLQVDDDLIQLTVWDTAGQERFSTITTSFFRGCNGVVFVYDVNDQQSFRGVKKWVSDFRNNQNSSSVKMLLLGNKCDRGGRVITTEQGEALAKELGCSFFETSAKSGLNVLDAFDRLAAQLTLVGRATPKKAEPAAPAPKPEEIKPAPPAARRWCSLL